MVTSLVFICVKFVGFRELKHCHSLVGLLRRPGDTGVGE
jgi:hypothetical protein